MSGNKKWLKIIVEAFMLPLLILALLPSCAQRKQAATLTVTVLDVGQGDSILLQSPSGHTVLIDGGGRGDEEPDTMSQDVGETVVLPVLRSKGIGKIDVLVLTHPHSDHVGGLVAVVRDEQIGCVLDGHVQPYPSAIYAAFEKEIADNHIRDVKAVRGMKINLGDGVTMDVLNPPTGPTPYGVGTDDTTTNDDSIVLRVTYKKVHIMLDGDAEVEAEDNMLAAYPAAYLHAEVLKAGHHGSRNASSDEWLNAVRPTYAVASCGLHNKFGHPHQETIDRMAAHHVKFFRTDLDGAVTFTTDGTHVTASTMLAR